MRRKRYRLSACGIIRKSPKSLVGEFPSMATESTDGGLPLNRRQFLQAAGVAGAELALVGPLAAAEAPSAHRLASDFAVRFENGAIVSLKRVADAFDTDYVQSGRRLGDVIVRYRHGTAEWQSLETATWTGPRPTTAGPDGARHTVSYEVPGTLAVDLAFDVGEAVLRWSIALRNLSSQPLEIGDLALPFPMNSSFQQQPTTAVLKHSFISGHTSFLFWMRRNSV